MPNDIPAGETRNPTGTNTRVKDRALRLIADVTGRKTAEVREIVNHGTGDYADKLYGLVEETLRPAIVSRQTDAEIKAALRKARDVGDINLAYEYLEYVDPAGGSH